MLSLLVVGDGTDSGFRPSLHLCFSFSFLSYIGSYGRSVSRSLHTYPDARLAHFHLHFVVRLVDIGLSPSTLRCRSILDWVASHNMVY